MPCLIYVSALCMCYVPPVTVLILCFCVYYLYVGVFALRLWCARGVLVLHVYRLSPDKLPAWVQHVLGHLVLNQDLATLHHQARYYSMLHA